MSTILYSFCVLNCVYVYCILVYFLIGHLCFMQLFSNKVLYFQKQYINYFHINQVIKSKNYVYKISNLYLSYFLQNQI